MKALCRNKNILSDNIMPELRSAVRQTAGSEWWTRRGWIAMTVDGTKMDVPRTDANENAFGKGENNKSHPQMMLTTIRHVGTGLPWDWRIDPARRDERHQLDEMIDDLPDRALLIADALYTSYDLLSTLIQSGKNFLVRVGSNMRLLQDLGLVERPTNSTVYLWPKYLQENYPPLVLRLIKIKCDKGYMYLITNVRKGCQLSKKDAAYFYEMRWGTEVFFRSTKQTLERRKMRCAAPEQAMLELHGTMIGMMVLGLMSVRGIIRRGKDPLEWSVAASLKVVRRAIDGFRQKIISLIDELGSCIKDRYVRKNPKAKRPWARKKRESPPGPPKVRRATIKEREWARQQREENGIE